MNNALTVMYVAVLYLPLSFVSLGSYLLNPMKRKNLKVFILMILPKLKLIRPITIMEERQNH